MAQSRTTWTHEQAVEFAARGRAAIAAKREERRLAALQPKPPPEPIPPNGDNAQARSVRLWAMLETIDARIAETLAHAHPSAKQVNVARGLAALAQALKAQAGPEEPKRKTQAQPAAVVLPEPLPETPDT